MRARHVLAAVAVALLATAPATPVVASPPRAAGPNGEAVVEIGNSDYVVQVGGGIRGIDALRAVATVETLNYGGSLGEAVCKINGIGDDPQPSSCPGGWRYYRATNGASGWSYSGAGASNTTVRGGDVEGWGYNSTPPFRPFCSVAHCAPPPPPPPPGQAGGPIPGGAYPPPGGGGSDGSNGGATPRTPGGPGGTGAPGQPGGPGDPTATTTAPDTTTTDSKEEGKGGSSSRAARTRLASDDSPGPGSPLSFIIFGVVLALLVAGVFVVRWARRRPAAATAGAGAPVEPGGTSDPTEPTKPTDAAT